ncbi:MAG: protein kinase [Deltaproteobacteria bacterium]|nr:protein kinase [Deltaproteobacteria bacterium]
MRACPRCFSVYQAEPEHCSFDGEKLSGEVDPLLGRTLAGYRLNELLGVGGTGCVYQGTVLATGAPCAVKLLYREMAADKSIAARFRREAEAVRRIRHPNVVAIIDYGTTPAGPIYLVMELLEGRTLKTLLEEEAPFTPARASRILEQLAAGLAEAHRVGYVHRDLKPGNVIIGGSMPNEKVKILDFGIVASLHERDREERLTKTGYIVGTPVYMAPEQIDPKAVAPQIDVYALGVILYEMLSGEPPFVGSLEQVLVGKMTQTPRPLANTGALGQLALRMLEVDPSKRPASALAVSAELNRAFLGSADPLTVRAEAPELSPVGQVGFAVPTIKVFNPDYEVDVEPGLRPASSASGWYGGAPPVPGPRRDTAIVETEPHYILAGPTPTGPGVAGIGEDSAQESPTKISPMSPMSPVAPSEADTGETAEHHADDDHDDIAATAEGPVPAELLALANANAIASGDGEGPTFDGMTTGYADTKLSAVAETPTPDLNDVAGTQDTWGPAPRAPLRFPETEPLSPGEPLEPTRPAIPRPSPPATVESTQTSRRLFYALAFGTVLMLAAVVAYLVHSRDTVIIDVPPVTPKS